MSTRPRVLVVDDDPDTIIMLAAGLTAIGCNIVGHARNGDDGVRLVRHLSPDLVIVDRETPILDGTTAIQLMKRARPDATIFAVTSAPGDDLRDAGASQVFDKTDIESLLDAAGKLAGNAIPRPPP